MNDEISAARKKRVRRIRRRRTALFLAFLALVSVGVLLANTLTTTTLLDAKDTLRTLTAPFDGYPVALEGGGAVCAKQMSMAYAVLSDEALTIYSTRGSLLASFPHAFTAPQLSTAGRRAALYNVGGKELCVYNRTSELAVLKTDDNIVDATLSADGTLAVLTRSEKYTAALNVYKNGKYEKSMTWYTNTGFPLLARMQSDGGAAAVACVGAENGRLLTTVTLIDTGAAKVLCAVQIEGIAADVLVNGGSFTVVTDERTALYNSAGEEKASYAYGDAPLLCVAHDEGAGLALAFGDNSRAQINTVVLFGSNLSLKSQAAGVGAVEDLYLARSALYVLGDGVATQYDMSCKVRARSAASDGAFALLKTGSLLAVSPDRIEKTHPMETTQEEPA